jgi:hypothetical protein
MIVEVGETEPPPPAVTPKAVTGAGAKKEESHE